MAGGVVKNDPLKDFLCLDGEEVFQSFRKSKKGTNEDKNRSGEKGKVKKSHKRSKLKRKAKTKAKKGQ